MAWSRISSKVMANPSTTACDLEAPHPNPLPEGRGHVKLCPLRRRRRGERAPVKLGALCRRSRRGRARAKPRGEIMNLSEPIIRKPVMTTVLTVSVILVGALSYRPLPVHDLPSVD